MDGMQSPDDIDDGNDAIAGNIEDNSAVNSPGGIDNGLVQQIQGRLQQKLPDLQSMGAFENLMKQDMQLSQAFGAILPEFLVAFVQLAQSLQQGGQNPGQANGAQVPAGPPGSQNDTAGLPQPGQAPPGGPPGAPPGAGGPPQMMPSQAPPGGPPQGGMQLPPGNPPPGPMPPPGATTTGNAPPSMPDQSGLRRQFFTGR